MEKNLSETCLFYRLFPADRFDRSSIPYVGYGDVNASRNVPINDHQDIGIGNFPNEGPHAGFIPLEGCCSSEAYQLLRDRKTS